MGNEIGSGLSDRAVCFDFLSTNIGSSVIGTCSTTGFDVITLQSSTYLILKYMIYKSAKKTEVDIPTTLNVNFR